jgi:hypothetical protein
MVGGLAFHTVPLAHDLVGTVFQSGDQLRHCHEAMKDIAAAGHLGHGQFLASTQAAAGIGDGGVGGKATLLQFQQAHAPGVGIAMALKAEQVAIGGSDIRAHQHGLVALENFVVGTDADVGQRLLAVVGPGLGHRLAKDVEHRADRHAIGEQVAHQFHDAAQGTVTDQDQSHDQLPQPGLGHGQIEKHLVVGRGGGKRLLQGGLGDGGLLVDKLAADVGIIRQFADGLVPSQSLNPKHLPLTGRQGFRGTTIGNCLL